MGFRVQAPPQQPAKNVQSAVVFSNSPQSQDAAREISSKILAELGAPADAIILFASPEHDHAALLAGIENASATGVVAGASSAGEFTGDFNGVGLACALALRGDDARFALAVGRDLKNDPASSARQIASDFSRVHDREYPHRSALVMADALAGHVEILVDELTVATAGQYQFFGGGAGDNANFKHTPVFFGREFATNAAVALEIRSKKPIGIGVSHGWERASKPFRVTEAHGARLVSLDGLPAFEAFEEYAAANHQKIDRDAPIPFFLQNVLGIETGSARRLRVPLAVDLDGAVLCAAEIPSGGIVYIMRSSNRSAVDAAERAASAAISGITGKPAAALFFDCVATRLRLGDHFVEELSGVKNRLGCVPLTGCNTHGQIARAEGQFNGFHNCTAVVAVFPE